MQRLRVMTYNIHGGRGMDGRIDLERLADVVAPFRPDIVAVQEVDVNRTRSGVVDQAEVLAQLLGLDLRFGCAIERGSERYGIATLSRLPFLDARLVSLPWRPSHPRSEPRCALVTRHRWNGTALDMVNTHLSIHFGERPGQVAALLDGLTSEDMVLAGDFNCTPWSPAYRALTRGLRAAASPRSWPSALPLFPLDHILYRGPLRVVRSGIWPSPLRWCASDHLPVIASSPRSPRRPPREPAAARAGPAVQACPAA